MPKFRKKPIVIEAVHFTGDNCDEVSQFFGGYGGEVASWKSATYYGGYINTLEGRMEFNVGDWIIRGVQGEFYPCRNDIFEATYEPADAEAVAND